MIRNSAQILGVPLTSTSRVTVLEEILNFKAKPKLIIFTPNPEFLVEAAQNPSFQEILSSSDINLPDGFGLVLAGKILGQPISERVSGADLTEQLLEAANKKGEMGGGKWTIGIVGVRRGVRSEASELIKRLPIKFPNITFVNLDDPNYQFQYSRLRPAKSAGFGGQAKFNVVFACQGMEKQEKWILENKDKINAKIFMGIGGSLDFLTGFAKRAPRWMRSFGLEWLWRGLQRPEHWRRIWRATLVFGWMVFKEKLKKLT